MIPRRFFIFILYIYLWGNNIFEKKKKKKRFLLYLFLYGIFKCIFYILFTPCKVCYLNFFYFVVWCVVLFCFVCCMVMIYYYYTTVHTKSQKYHLNLSQSFYNDSFSYININLYIYRLLHIIILNIIYLFFEFFINNKNKKKKLEKKKFNDEWVVWYVVYINYYLFLRIIVDWFQEIKREVEKKYK